MEVVKINLVGYYNYDPVVRFKQLYDCNETDARYHDIYKNVICHICKENILEHSTNISSNINKLFYKNSVVLGNCGHIFHKNCMHEWLKYNDCCPIDKVDWSYDRDLDTVSNLFFENNNELGEKVLNSQEFIEKRKKKDINFTIKENKLQRNNIYQQEQQFIDINKSKCEKKKIFREDLSYDKLLNTKNKIKEKKDDSYKVVNENIITNLNDNEMELDNNLDLDSDLDSDSDMETKLMVDDYDMDSYEINNNIENQEEELIELLNFENDVISDDETIKKK